MLHDMWKKKTVLSIALIALAFQGLLGATEEKESEGSVHYLLNPTWNPAADYFDGSGKPPKFLLIEEQKKELNETFWGVDTPEEVLKASDALNGKKKILISTATPKACAGAHWKLLDDVKKLCKSEGYTLYVAYGK